MSNNALFLKLYLDEDFHPDLADMIRRNGFDCQNTIEAGMLGTTDEEQLKYAAAQGRCLIRFNVRDFAILARQWSNTSRSHSGILVTPQVSRQALGKLLQTILSLLNTTTADEMKDVFRYL